MTVTWAPMADSPGADYRGTDFYCDVAVPARDKLDIEFEDDHVMAFRHTKPFWETHIVVIPIRHIPSLTQTADADDTVLRALFRAVQIVARRVEETCGAAAVLTNLGDYQDSKHLHVHVHSGPRRE